MVEAVRPECRVDLLRHAVVAVFVQPVLEQCRRGHDGLLLVALRGEAETIEMAETRVALEQRVSVRLAVGRQPLDRDRAHQATQHPGQLVERRIVLLGRLVVLLGLREFCDVAVAQIEIVLLERSRVCGCDEGEQAEQDERSHCDVRKG